MKSDTKPVIHLGENGFTIIELMITLVIVAIMLSMAVPSFTSLIRNNRTQTASTSLVAAFNLARAEAIRRGRPVSICAVDDPGASPPACGADWATGWAIFVDANADNAIDAGEELRVGDASSSVVIGGPATLVTFASRGEPTAGAGAYVFNAANCTSGADKQYTVDLGTVGRTKNTEGLCP